MSIAKIIEVVLRRKIAFLLVFDIGLVALLAWIANKPIMYGQVALLDPYKEVQPLLTAGRTSGLPTINREPTRFRKNTPDENQDLKQYLTFRYGIKGAAADTSTVVGAYLESVKYERKTSSSYLELYAYANTLENANTFLNQLLKNLQNEATPKIQAFIDQSETQIKDFKAQMREKQRQIREIDNSLNTLGFIPNLVDQKEEYRAILTNLKYLTQTLEKGIEPSAISNHQFKSIRPISQSPVEPNWVKLLAMGLGGLLIFSFYFVLFLEAIFGQKQELQTLVTTESPEEALRRRRAANPAWSNIPEDPTMDPQVLYIRGPISQKRLLNPSNRRRGNE